MLYLSNALVINYKKKAKNVEILFKNFNISKNKEFMIQIDRWGYGFTIIGFTFAIIMHQDHAGIKFGIDILGYSFLLNFSDKRHWDRTLGQWEEL